MWVRWRTRIIITTASLMVMMLSVRMFGPELCLWKATSFLETRSHEKALWWLNASTWLQPANGETNFLFAKTYRRLGMLKEAGGALDLASKQGFRRNAIDRETWLILAQSGQFAKVHSHWNELFLDAGSDGPEISRAFVLMSLQRFQIEHALRVIAGWKADFPNDAEPYFQEGRIAGVGLRWKDAEHSYREALKRASNRIDIREGLVESLMKQLKLDDAQIELRQLIEQQPSSVNARVHLADCLLRTDRSDEARMLLNEAISTQPECFAALVLLGQLELSTAHAEEATRILGRAVKLHPEDAEVRYAYAKALRATGKEEEAAEHFRFRDEATKPLLRLSDAISELIANPASTALRFEVGELTWKWKSRDEGVMWLHSVLEQNPVHHPTHAILAQHYEMLGQNDRAAQHKKLAVESP